jgi:hypothetical protein
MIFVGIQVGYEMDNSDWKKMKQSAFEAFKSVGIMSVQELEKIVDIGLADGQFDDNEKKVLINIISNLTGAEMTDAMWLKVDELIHKFDLHGDSEAFIEHLEDEHDF